MDTCLFCFLSDYGQSKKMKISIKALPFPKHFVILPAASRLNPNIRIIWHFGTAQCDWGRKRRLSKVESSSQFDKLESNVELQKE